MLCNVLLQSMTVSQALFLGLQGRLSLRPCCATVQPHCAFTAPVFAPQHAPSHFITPPPPALSMSVTPPPNFAQTLIDWHHQHGRHDLPWQNTRDPYRIWLSEIMLQQTQVDTVMPYYARFLARFPDVASLAAAEQDEVLGLWSGLGYYARARNLHKAARAIMSDWGGQFPQCAADLASLPGIGRSTAAAIASFAFGERAAILDGNVKRVLCRVFGIDGFPGEKAIETRLWALADSLLPEQDVGIYTQAQMDLGATLCTRSRPACGRCPFAPHCVAHVEQRTSSLPASRPRKVRPTRTTHMVLITHSGNEVLLQQRASQGIWGGLLSLPEAANSEPEEQTGGCAAELAARLSGAEVRSLGCGEPLQHAFTHFTLIMTPEVFEASSAFQPPAEHVWLNAAELASAPLPAPIRTLLERFFSGSLLAAPRLPGL